MGESGVEDLGLEPFSHGSWLFQTLHGACTKVRPTSHSPQAQHLRVTDNTGGCTRFGCPVLPNKNQRNDRSPAELSSQRNKPAFPRVGGCEGARGWTDKTFLGLSLVGCVPRFRCGMRRAWAPCTPSWRRATGCVGTRAAVRGSFASARPSRTTRVRP